jgi:hypothetical protein
MMQISLNRLVSIAGVAVALGGCTAEAGVGATTPASPKNNPAMETPATTQGPAAPTTAGQFNSGVPAPTPSEQLPPPPH